MTQAGARPFPDDATSTAAALARLAAAAPGARMGPRARRVEHRPSAARRRRERLGTRGMSVNMTPMIDVTFLLLVFFIATTRFSGDENVLRMDLGRRTAPAPAAGASAAAAPAAPKADPFAYADDALRLDVQPDGTITAGSPLGRTFTPAELRAALATERRSPERPAGMFETTFPIVIAPTRGASWEAAVEALNAAVGAGYVRVGFERAAPGTRGTP
jgi:biopolymer transport protein ExbD